LLNYDKYPAQAIKIYIIDVPIMLLFTTLYALYFVGLTNYE